MLESVLARYGLVALFAGAALEGETVVLIGGLLAHRGVVSYAGAVAATAAGSFFFDQLCFALGRHFRGHPRVVRLSARPAFARALAAFERHPYAFVFAFRFLYGLRTASPMAIGTTRLSTSRFLILNGAAALLWATLFTTLGYVSGHGVELLFGRFRSVEHVLLVGLALSLLFFGGRWLLHRRRNRRAGHQVA